MADINQVRNQSGVLIQQWDDNTSTYTEYDPTTGAQTLSRAYTAAETSQAQVRANIDTALGNLATLQSKAHNALNTNANYLGGTQTSAQAVTQVGVLTRQMDAVIKILMNLLSDTAGT